MNNDDKPFSEREGFVTVVQGYQTDAIDNPTRTRIYNKVHSCFLQKKPHLKEFPELDDDLYHYFSDEYLQGRSIAFKHFFWTEFLSQPIDNYTEDNCLSCIRKMFLEDDPWHKIFDFVERILSCCDGGSYGVDSLNAFFHKEAANLLISGINQVMTDMKVGYKIIANKFVPIFLEQEKEAIEMACDTPFNGANQHIKKALNILANRENPDCENSIKESILAVESIAKEITGKEKSLNALTQELKLHPNFKNGLDELYDWTSKDGGMRHGKSGKSLTADKNTARFMLVACSAFVNYIISRNPQKHER